METDDMLKKGQVGEIKEIETRGTERHGAKSFKRDKVLPEYSTRYVGVVWFVGFPTKNSFLQAMQMK